VFGVGIIQNFVVFGWFAVCCVAVLRWGIWEFLVLFRWFLVYFSVFWGYFGVFWLFFVRFSGILRCLGLV